MSKGPVCRTLAIAASVLWLSGSAAAEEQNPAAKLSHERLVEVGKAIYFSPGPNTCNDCHGQTGEKGSRPAAANLTKPDTWRVTKGLNGDPQKTHVALIYLIRNGSIRWNIQFKKDHPEIPFDWEKAGEPKYNAEMFGITQAGTQERMRQLREELEAKDGLKLTDDEMKTLSAEAALAYVATLSTAGKP